MTDLAKLISAVNSVGIPVARAADAAQVTGWVDTGNMALNHCISGRWDRGYPLGHLVELFGDPATGKSYLAGRAIATFQRDYPEGVVVLDDTEGAFNPIWAETLGIDPDKVLRIMSNTVEEHHALVKTLIDEVDPETPMLIVLDSLALLSTRHEVEAAFDTQSMRRAKDIRKHFRVLGAELHGRPILYLVTNHVIAKIGARAFESNRTTGGGGGPKYEASVRIDLRTPKKVKDKEGEIVGVAIRAVLDKNRITPPFQETSMVVPFYTAVSPYSGLVARMLAKHMIGMEGRSLKVGDEKTSIAANKTDLLAQAESGEQLVEAYPQLFEASE